MECTLVSRSVFDHLLKTGGTSVRAAMGNAFGETDEMPESGSAHHLAIAAAGTRRFLSWHLWFLTGEALAKDWYYATILRDPVDRFLSQYYFHHNHHDQVRSGAISDPEVVAAATLELEDYLRADDPAIRRSYTNMQAMHFAWRVSGDPSSLSEKELLEAAISSLEEYDLVGVFSDIQGFVDTYCDAMSLTRQTVERLNATSVRKQVVNLPAFAAKRLQEVNAVDTALYAWAQQRFLDGRASTKSGLPATRRGAAEVAAGVDFGNRQIRIDSITCRGLQSGTSQVAPGEKVLITLACQAFVSEPDLTVGIAVKDMQEVNVFGTNSRLQGKSLSVLQGQEFTIRLLLDTSLIPGEHRVTLALHKGESHLEGCYHWLGDTFSFTVVDDGTRSPSVNSGTLEIELLTH